MGLFIPETGLLFWMLLAFGIVFFILAKYGWPAIIGMVEKRSDFINNAIKEAEEAHSQLENIKITSEEILSDARQKQLEILQEGASIKNKMIEDAKKQAVAEANKIIQAAQMSIQKEKDEALKDVRKQVAALSLDIAEKIMRRQLKNNEAEQMKLIDKLLEEMNISQS